MQVLTIATHRPASLIAFFKQRQGQTKGSDAAIVSCAEAVVGMGLVISSCDSCAIAPIYYLCRHERLQGSTQGQGLMVM